MKEKYLSMIVIPHKGGKQRAFSISRKTFKLLTYTIPTVLVILLVFLVDYFGMSGTREKYRNLRTENQNQKETLVKYQTSINNLETTIKEFEQYRTKLNVIAGLKSEDKLEGEPGVGGPGGQMDMYPPPVSAQNLERLVDITTQAEGIKANFSALEVHFVDQLSLLAQTPSIMPTQGYISSAYKYRDDPFTGKRTFHPGIDIATQTGNPIIATADGTVISTKTDKTGGNTVKISHPKTGYITMYCHLSKFLTRPGQKVKRGDVIGLIGKTGRARGPHVHYEVRLNGKKLNPWHFLLDL